MTKEEFEQAFGGKVPESDYKTIEYVYTWHPAIEPTDGKKQIAAIYKAGGIMVINDMARRANFCEAADGRIRRLRQEIEERRNEIDEILRQQTGII